MKKLLIFVFSFWIVGGALATNTVSLSSAQGHPGDTLEMRLSLSNSDEIVAFQTEIPLSGAFHYVLNSAVMSVRAQNFAITAYEVHDTLKIVAYSFSLSPMSDNDGEVLSFKLIAGTMPGAYAMALHSTLLSDNTGQSLPVSCNNGTFTVLSPKLKINTNQINYGHVPIRSSYYQNLSLTNIGNELLTISSLSFSAPEFSCGNLSVTIAPGSTQNLTIQYTPTRRGAVTEKVTVHSNSILDNPLSPLPFVPIVADPYSVNELHVLNTAGHSDSIVNVSITMNNMDSIVGLQCQFVMPQALEYVPGSFTLNGSRVRDHQASAGIIANGNQEILTLVAFSPTNTPFVDADGTIATFQVRLNGQYGTYSLTPNSPVLSDISGMNVLSQSYKGNVTIQSPRISCGSSINLGVSSVTDTVEQNFYIYNNSNAPLIINDITFSKSGYSVRESLPCTLANYNSTYLHIRYSGTQNGVFDATMYVYCNDPTNRVVFVPISGTRYEPNGITLSSDADNYHNDVHVAVNLNNYSDITAVQYDFVYPSRYYTVSSSDFIMTNRGQNHSLLAMPLNDSTYRVLVFSIQNAPIVGHSESLVNVVMHPKDNAPAGSYEVSLENLLLSDQAGQERNTEPDPSLVFTTTVPQYSVSVNQVEGGTVSGNIGTFDENTDIELNVNTEPCYVFLSWNDGNTDNPRTIVLTQDTVFTPVFEWHIDYNTVDVVACESYTWIEGNGQTYNESGNYTYTHQNEYGCTQVDTLHLSINPSYSFNESLTMPDDTSFVWREQQIDCSNLTSGIYFYSDTLQSISGCDSVYNLELIVVHNDVNTVYATAFAQSVENDVLIFIMMNNESDITAAQFDIQLPEAYSVQTSDFIKGQRCLSHTLSVSVLGNNTYRVMLFSMQNQLFVGDSGEVITVNLHPYANTQAGTNNAILSNVIISDVNGQNRITDLIPNILFTTYCTETIITETRTICDNELPYLWDGVWYEEGGSYVDTIPTTHGCDSILSHTLVVNVSNETIDTVMACDYYTWCDSTYTVSGEYVRHFQNINGCDSIVTLLLTIYDSPIVYIIGDTLISSGESSVLTANGALYYLWSTEEITPSIVVSPTMSTLYYVVGSDEHNCVGRDSIQVTVSDEITPYLLGTVLLYPNPTQNQIEIVVPDELSLYQLSIYDAVGHQVYQNSLQSENRMNITVDSWSQGMYFVRMVTSKGLIVKKFVKE